MKTGWAVAYGSVLGLLSAGLIFWILGKPVQSPGLYSLPPGSRVSDALTAAGGPLPGADLKPINPARLVEEGERIYVPYEPAAVPVIPTAARSDPIALPESTEGPPAGPAPTSASLRVNINIATQAELEALPRIGPVTAQAIIAYRNTNGPFKTIEELMDVKGIGPATLEALKPFITVGD
jgi:competence protein ComEA